MRQPDHGPALRRQRGEVLLEWRADPADDRLSVQGARVRDTLREMHARRRLTDAQFLAAERYRDDTMMVAGQGIGSCVGALRLMPGGGGAAGWLPGDALLAAQMRLRQADAVLRADERAVVAVMVLGDATMAEAARHLHCAKASAARRLRDVLDTLARCYGMFVS